MINRKPLKEATKQKISAKMKGRKRSPESRVKQRESLIGRTASEETKAKMAAAWVIRRARKLTEQQTTKGE